MPKSNLDWLGVVSGWIGAVVMAFKAWNAPLVDGAPSWLAADFWNYVPAILLSVYLGVALYRLFRPLPVAHVTERADSANVAAPNTAPIYQRRQLSSAQKADLTRRLVGIAPADGFAIMRDNASRDAVRYASDFDEVFRGAGWNPATGGTSGATIFPHSGIGVNIPNPSTVPPHTRAVMIALEANGIGYDIISADMLFGDGIYITDPE